MEKRFIYAPRDLLNEQGMRIDGRRATEFRNFRMRLGVFDKPNGSAYLEQGNTKVLCALYGPSKSSSRRSTINDDFDCEINCSAGMTTFSAPQRKSRPRGDRKTGEISRYIKEAMKSIIIAEKYKNCTIDIIVEILQVDGGDIAAAVNCAMLTLIDAGIEIKEYITACTASITPSGGIIRDISAVEESAGAAALTVATLSCSNKLIFAEMSQRFHSENMDNVLEEAMLGCRDVAAMIDDRVRYYVETNVPLNQLEVYMTFD